VKHPTQILCPQLVLTDATLSSKSTRQTGHSEASSVHLGLEVVGETNRITCSGAGRGGGTYGGRGTAAGAGRGAGTGTGAGTGAGAGAGTGRGPALARRHRHCEQEQMPGA
jgi:hypothetical protein